MSVPRSANAANGVDPAVKSDTVTARDVATRDCFAVVVIRVLLNRSLPSSSSSNSFFFFSGSHRIDVVDVDALCAVWTTTLTDDDEPWCLFFRDADDEKTPGRKKDVVVDNATCIGVVLCSASGAFFDDRGNFIERFECSTFEKKKKKKKTKRKKDHNNKQQQQQQDMHSLYYTAYR